MSISRDKLHGLSSRQFFTILLRLVAIVVLLKPIVSEFGLIFMLIYHLLESDSYFATTGVNSWLLVFAPTFASAFIAGLMWYFAPILACLAAPVNAPLIADLGGVKTALMIGLVLLAVW
ncbi:MAG: hypothetical protein AB8C95_13690, partial [Phycisphaeraceae bacterium]